MLTLTHLSSIGAYQRASNRESCCERAIGDWGDLRCVDGRHVEPVWQCASGRADGDCAARGVALPSILVKYNPYAS